MRKGELERLAARALAAPRRAKEEEEEVLPPLERRCTCRRPLRDRCYLGTWTCRRCAQPIASEE